VDSNQRRLSRERSFLLEAAGENLRPSTQSYYLDQVAAQVPPGIVLDQLACFPKEADLPPSLELASLPDMFLAGQASHAAAISRFSQALSELGFVKEVTLISSAYDFRRQGHQFQLSLTLLPR
jgi:Tfp pilus assembly protein PilN